MVKLWGLFQGLVCALIVFGDKLGGYLLFILVLASHSECLKGVIFEHSFMNWGVKELQEFAFFKIQMAVALALMCCQEGKKIRS